jgi:putative ABC transport system substrate-binding protein
LGFGIFSGRIRDFFPAGAKMQIGFTGRAVRIAALTVTILLASGPQLSAGQVPHVLIVGPLNNYGALLTGVLDGLHSAGFADESRIRIEPQSASSPDEAKAAIAAALSTGVDAIVTVFGPPTQAASAATTTVPIIFCPVADPVASKLAASSNAPGGNLTGVATADAEASRRRIAAFRQVLPHLKRLAVLFDSGFTPDRVQMKNFEEIAPSSGIVLVSRAIADESAAAAALQALGPGDADAVFILKDSLLRNAGDALKSAALGQKLPILVGDPDLIEFPGVVAAVGPNQHELGKICGHTTAKILKGAKPGALPIEHPVFDLLVNLKSAQGLGLTVPEKALEHAVRVVR